METGNIRRPALNWFASKHPLVSENIFTSKFYTPQQSWSKTRVWFFQLPLDVIEPNRIKHLHLVCENHLAGEPFIYLKVPTLFLLMNEKSFEVSQKEKVMRIYLSAEAVDKFQEVRKGSKLDFKRFVQNV